MKRTILQLLCAVATMIVLSLCLCCVASADSFNNTQPVSVSTYPVGTVLDGFWDSEGEAARDSLTKRTTLEVVRDSMMQDFVPLLESALSSENTAGKTAPLMPFHNTHANGNSTLAFLDSSRWGSIINVITDNLELDSSDSGVDDSFKDAIRQLANIDDETKDLFINFEDNGVYYSLAIPATSPEGTARTYPVANVLKGLRQAMLESVTGYTYCIYEYNGTPTLSSLSSISTDKTHLAYIVSPFVGVIPCNITGHEIKNFSDYLDNFYAVKGGVLEDYNPNVRWFPSRTFKSDSAISFNTMLQRLSEEESPKYSDRWKTSAYTCYFTGIIKDTAPNPTKYYPYLHPDYIAFASQILSKDAKYTTGLTNIADCSDLAVSFRARKNATQSPICLLNTLYPLGYINEWKYTNTFGIYTSLFSTTTTASTSSLGKAAYYYGLRNQGAVSDIVRYHYDFLRDTTPSTSITASSDEEFIAGTTHALGAFYYYDILSGKVYKNVMRSPAQAVGGKITPSTSPYVVGTFLCAPIASRLLGTFTATNITLDRSTLYATSVTMIPPSVDANRVLLDSPGSIVMESNFVSTLIVPSTYMECIGVSKSDTRQDPQSNSSIQLFSRYMVGTGRKVSFDLTKVDTMNLIDTDGTVKFVQSGEPAAGVYYNAGGKIYTTSKDNIQMHAYMLDDGPAIELSSAYLEQSNVLAWIETSQAGTYISGNAKITGFTADSLYKYLIDKGITIGGKVGKDDADRLDEIADELQAQKQAGIIGFIKTLVAFVGIILMIYACLLVICFYIDIFNTISSFSLLQLITFGGYKAIAKKSDLDALGITDPKEKRKYVDRLSIIVRWAAVMGFGLLLFGSSQIFVWLTMLYNWLAGLFGI